MRQPAAAVAKPGFGDCDNDAKNGAETDLSSTVQHCGACGQACKDVFPPAGHGEFSCVDGRCSLRCDDGWEACEGVTAGCNTDLSRDYEHCGKCGTACMLSYCQGGTCVEPKTVVREIEAWKLVASTREGAYILDDAFPLPVRTMVVFVVPFDGGEPRKVTFGDLVPMASDGEHLYGCRTPVGPHGSDCRLARKPVAGGAVQSLAVVKKAHPWTCLAADEGHVYLYVETGEEQGSIVAVPVAGGEVKKLLDTPEVASLAADEGTVFYGTNFTKNGETAVYALPKGATKPILLTKGLAQHLAVDDGYLYADIDSELRRIPRKGGEAELLARPAAGRSLRGFAVTEDAIVYCESWVGRGPGSHSRVQKAAVLRVDKPTKP